MIIKKRSGRRGVTLLAGVFVCLFNMDTAKAWQQEYIVDDQQSNTTERYTWDSDHQPDYNDILAERIRSAQNVPGLMVNLPDSTPLDASSAMSLGWNFPLVDSWTTGPVAQWHYDGSTPSIYNEFGDSVVNQALPDPLWHASISSLGWRVDSRFGDLRPWAQISYNQQFGDNLWKSQSGLSRLTPIGQEGNWIDVTVGADMLLNQHLAAYAALSQAENTSTGENYLYTMGVSARF
ncbi:autotransporter domain-containing protein [Superficieibacter sp.]|uniref:autotransporter domain-containing protein n=1 Tax=Superficieibacter sp. TaxID=2303322 RepID=UPI0028B2315A|nr:autotransporter domain-containing protein [Superficieibacter sp.]